MKAVIQISVRFAVENPGCGFWSALSSNPGSSVLYEWDTSLRALLDWPEENKGVEPVTFVTSVVDENDNAWAASSTFSITKPFVCLLLVAQYAGGWQLPDLK